MSEEWIQRIRLMKGRLPAYLLGCVKELFFSDLCSEITFGEIQVDPLY